MRAGSIDQAKGQDALGGLDLLKPEMDILLRKFSADKAVAYLRDGKVAGFKQLRSN